MTVWLLKLSFTALCIVSSTIAEEDSGSKKDGPTYQFKYHVDDQMTMDYKTHEEVGENGLVHGSYTVREPNGDIRVVSYTAGDSGGFRAMVRVRPTQNPGAENSTYLGLNDKLIVRNDSPLKIQLNTEPKSDQPQQRDQRHSISARFNSTKRLETNSTNVQITAEKLQNLNSRKMYVKGDSFSRTHKSQSLASPLGNKMPPVKEYKYSSHHRTILPSPQKQELSAYVPLHVSSIQETQHYGHFLTPLLLHVVPARFPRKLEAKYSSIFPMEQSSSKTTGHVTKETTLCSAGHIPSNQSGDG